MSDVTPVVIILQTYERTDYAKRTIKAAKENLIYPDLRWYIADDGSPKKHFNAVKRALRGQDIIGSHNEDLGYGATANKALRAADDISPITLWLEDDWELKRPLDLADYVALLEEDQGAGMIRLAHIPIDLEGITGGWRGQILLRLYATRQYFFSGNPSLRHRRFFEAYNLYPEGLKPGETELKYDEQIQATGGGPNIYIPIDAGSWGYFGHIGEVKSYD